MLELCTLGPPRAFEGDGSERRELVARARRFALLVYLATEQAVHRRDSLLAMFWPGLDTRHARSALRQALHALRDASDPPLLLTRGREEVLANPDSLSCDATLFDGVAAREPLAAVALYRGPFLDGFFVSGAPAFDEWMAAKRASLARKSAAAAWNIAQNAQAVGDSILAMHWARWAAALTPDDERATARLIAVLAGAGDRVAAVQVYRRFSERLCTEFALEPSNYLLAALEDMQTRPGAASGGASI